MLLMRATLLCTLAIAFAYCALVLLLVGFKLAVIQSGGIP